MLSGLSAGFDVDSEQETYRSLQSERSMCQRLDRASLLIQA